MTNRVERLLSTIQPVDTDAPAPPLPRRRYLFVSTLLLIMAVALAGNIALAVALMVC